MKSGYKRLLLFELFIFIVLFVNSFVFDILSKYKMVIFLLLIIFLFWKICGIEKDKHRFVKDIILDVIIFLFIFFIVFYLSGLIIGFTRPGNYYTLGGLKNYILPTILTVILKEYFRYVTICKAEGSKLAIVVSVLLFIFIDVTQVIRVSNFATPLDTFNFVSITLLPAISSNIALTYIANIVGYKPNIIYSLVMHLYRYLLPLIPNPSPYIYSIIMLVVPVLLAADVYRFNNKYKDKELTRDYKKKKLSGLILLVIPTIVLTYFISGYFRYHAIVVASGSMMPTIYKGDVVIIDREKIDYNSLKEGEVLAFYHDNKIIVHRLIRVYEHNGEFILYTKGDNNDFEDDFITPKDVYGVVRYKVPYIGLLTVWINKL